MLQTGIGFEALRGGHKKCSGFNRTYIARAAIEPPAYSNLCRRNATRLQLQTWYIITAWVGLYKRL